MEALLAAGKIRSWGVSNFDVADMEELWRAGGGACAANQVLYNPEHRGIEFDLMAWQSQRRVPVMAYTPLGQAGKLLRAKVLATVAARHGATPAQVALAWSIRSGNVIAIPKASSLAHVRANAAAAALRLEAVDLAAIDAGFPPPRRKQALAML
jgi:diketogulonate reductase-like aldo/keto reductase